jgi:CBS domain-containing protein
MLTNHTNIANRLATRRLKPAERRLLARDIMTPEPLTIESTTSIRDALHLMAVLKIRHLPVVDAGTPTGIISDRDVRVFAAEASASVRNVGSVIDGQLISVELSAPLKRVSDAMIEHHVDAIAVLDRDGKLAGIVSYVDVLRALAHCL